MISKAKTMDDFWALAGDRADDLVALDKLILASAPDLSPVKGRIFMGMLSYGLVPYKTKSGSNYTEWPAVMLAPQKNYLSLYVCAADKKGNYLAETYCDRLGKVSCGKSCIRFKKLDDLDLKVVEEMLRSVNQQAKDGTLSYGS